MLDLERLKDSLVRHEGMKLTPYRCSAGKLTIGVGRNLEDNGITQEEAMLLLDHDLKWVLAGLDLQYSWWRELDEARQVVLADMAFNLGLPSLGRFKKFLMALRSGDYDTAAAEMLDSEWAGQVGNRARELAALMRGEAAA